MELPRNSVIEKQTNDKITILNSRIVRSTVQDFSTIANGNIRFLQMKNKVGVVNLSIANTQDSAERSNISSFEIAAAFNSNFKSIENPPANNTFKTDVHVLRGNSSFDTNLEQTCIGQFSNNIGVSHNDNNRLLNLDNGIVSIDTRRDSNVIGIVSNDNLRDSRVSLAGNDADIVSNDSWRVSNVIGRVLNDNVRDLYVPIAENDSQKV